MLPTSSRHLQQRHRRKNGNWRRPITRLSYGSVAFLLLTLRGSLADGNPHEPQLLTWEVVSPAGHVAWSISGTHTPGTWWPSLYPDVCKLVQNWDNLSWDMHPGADTSHVSVPGCLDPWRRFRLRQLDFYACPEGGRTKQQIYNCGGVESFYCKAWGCETTGDVSWLKHNDDRDWITVHKNFPPNGDAQAGHRRCLKSEFSPWGVTLNITFTPRGIGVSTLASWVRGRIWGMRYYVAGYDFGLWFTIRLKRETIPVPEGPNPAVIPQPVPRPLPEPSHKSEQAVTSKGELGPTPGQSTTIGSNETHLIPPPLFKLIQGAYKALNYTQQGMVPCWLCLSAAPLYYEGIAVSGTPRPMNASSCDWKGGHKLTIPKVRGHGLCIGTVPASRSQLCNQSHQLNTTTSAYWAPPDGAWWACNTGITPCVSTSIFNQGKNFCVMIMLLPRILYHDTETFEEAMENKYPRVKREPVTLTLAALLGLGVAAGIGTGTATLITENQHLAQLKFAIAQDIQNIENSVIALEQSITSLSEVVLQNRRGLDLIFIKKGGLCAALKKKCYFYVDKTGVARNNMAQLKKKKKR